MFGGEIMACPGCGCKVTYFHSYDIDGYEREKCPAWNFPFYTMDVDDDEDELEEPT
jgi:hypothetical protein